MRDECREDHRDLSHVRPELRGRDCPGNARAAETLRNVKSGWVKEQTVHVDNDKVTNYQVNLMVTFVLE